MRVQIVDPPAFTPPYDHSLCTALAAAGVEVELVTSRFTHGSVPSAEGYRVRESFYRRSARESLRPRLRRTGRRAEHLPGMLRQRRHSRQADVVHYQWLTAPALDSLLLPRRVPKLLTPHGWLRREGWDARPPAGLRRLFDRMDMLVSLSVYGAARLREAGVEAERIRVIPHGVLDYLTRLPDPAPLPHELEGSRRPVVLAFGLIRPYKGVEVLVEAFRELPHAELWVVGRPFGVDLNELRRRASAMPARVRFLPRFVADREVPAIFERADVVALPYLDAEQSGVLHTALAFGKAIVLSDVGGFPEVAAEGAARLVPPGDAAALAAALDELVLRPDARERLEAGARAAAAGPYSWEAIAAQTLALYGELLGG